MAPTDAQRIEHILEAIETIEERVADLDESAFVADDVVHDAVLYQLALLGEAPNSSVNLRIVWQTIQKDLPELKSAMENDPSLSRGRSQSRGQGRKP